MQDNLVPLSFLSQYGYCPRRAGLLMLDCIWADNIFTVEGSIAHERAHSGNVEARSGCIKLFDVPLASYNLGLSGKTDCLELYPDNNGIYLSEFSGKYRLCPVEYKHGVLRNEREYQVQLCGQALCLEEMLGCSIDKGVLYFIGSKKREEIYFDTDLRNEVTKTVAVLKELLDTKVLPPAIKSSKCHKCSISGTCMPDLKRKREKEYVKNLIEWAKEGDSL